jgi:hypothetical protein
MVGPGESGTAKGVAAELAVVFVGVLIALGVNSWWAAHQDHARLHADLQTLAQDMDQAALVLDTAIRYDSANVALFTEIHDGLLAHDSARYDRLASLPDLGIRIAPVPLGTLRFLVDGGEVRLIQNPEERARLIEDLSKIELYQGWMDDLATEGRHAFDTADRAIDESAVRGTRWPEAAVGNPDVISAMRLAASRISNIVLLQRRILALVQEIGSAAGGEVKRP